MYHFDQARLEAESAIEAEGRLIDIEDMNLCFLSLILLHPLQGSFDERGSDSLATAVFFYKDGVDFAQPCGIDRGQTIANEEASFGVLCEQRGQALPFFANLLHPLLKTEVKIALGIDLIDNEMIRFLLLPKRFGQLDELRSAGTDSEGLGHGLGQKKFLRKKVSKRN